MIVNDFIKTKGTIYLTIEDFEKGTVEQRVFYNNLLNTGKAGLASSLANQIGDTYDFFISRMIFGDGGTDGGVEKFVNPDRNGLFGITRASKPIIANIDSATPSVVTFTSVVTTADANGFVLNEMALQMNNGNLYSMATFGDVTKTSAMQMTWVWQLMFL